MSHRSSRIRSILLALAFGLVGCAAKSSTRFSSAVRMSDPSSGRQLIAGFHNLEQHRWRWTERRFAVVLQPPPGSEQYGATLQLKLYVAAQSIQKLGPITLTAQVEDLALAPEVFAKDGIYLYTRELPASVFHGTLFPVAFSLDKALALSDSEFHELGTVVEEVSLVAKK